MLSMTSEFRLNGAYFYIYLKKEFGLVQPTMTQFLWDLRPLLFQSALAGQGIRLRKVGMFKMGMQIEVKDQRKQLTSLGYFLFILIPLLYGIRYQVQTDSTLSGCCHSTLYSFPLAHELLECRYYIVLIFSTLSFQPSAWCNVDLIN